MNEHTCTCAGDQTILDVGADPDLDSGHQTAFHASSRVGVTRWTWDYSVAQCLRFLRGSNF